MAWDSDYRYEPSPLFEGVFQCLPFSKYKNPHLETGNKIIMPPSSLTRILNLPIKCPFFFKIEGFRPGKTSHCGVLEFEAEEGSVYVPEWMMKSLNLLEGARVVIRDAALSKGLYMELQPHTTSFTELANPKAVLERTLRGFSCLSCGDTIMIKHGETDFYIDVLKVSPGDAVSLIDTDCRVEFAPPLDYQEPESRKQEIVEKADEEGKMYWKSMGRGRRLDEAVTTVGFSVVNVVVEERKKSEKEEGGKEKFKPFTGRSRVLRGH